MSEERTDDPAHPLWSAWLTDQSPERAGEGPGLRSVPAASFSGGDS